MAALWAILPTIVVLTLFFWVLRSIIRADRNERREYARIEAEERAARRNRAVTPLPTTLA